MVNRGYTEQIDDRERHFMFDSVTKSLAIWVDNAEASY